MPACLHAAGQAASAVELYERWLTPQAFTRRDYGYFLSHAAEAMADAGDVKGATTNAQSALTLARTTASARTYRQILRVVGQLRPWWSRPDVQRLRVAVGG